LDILPKQTHSHPAAAAAALLKARVALLLSESNQMFPKESFLDNTTIQMCPLLLDLSIVSTPSCHRIEGFVQDCSHKIKSRSPSQRLATPQAVGARGPALNARKKAFLIHSSFHVHYIVLKVSHTTSCSSKGASPAPERGVAANEVVQQQQVLVVQVGHTLGTLQSHYLPPHSQQQAIHSPRRLQARNYTHMCGKRPV